MGGGGCQAALFFVPRESLTLRCRPPTPLVVLGSVIGSPSKTALRVAFFNKNDIPNAQFGININ